MGFVCVCVSLLTYSYVCISTNSHVSHVNRGPHEVLQEVALTYAAFFPVWYGVASNVLRVSVPGDELPREAESHGDTHKGQGSVLGIQKQCVCVAFRFITLIDSNRTRHVRAMTPIGSWVFPPRRLSCGRVWETRPIPKLSRKSTSARRGNCIAVLWLTQ